MYIVGVILAALISTFSITMQFTMVGMVFQYDVNCRKQFDTSNTSSSINQKECELSLTSKEMMLLNCHCRAKIATTNWLRISDDASVAMASLLAIALIIMELVRFWIVCYQVIFVGDDLTTHPDSCVLFSLAGLLAMMLSPAVQAYIKQNKNEILVREMFWIVLFDCFAIGVSIRYCIATNCNFTDSIVILTIWASSLDIFSQLFCIYLINSREYLKTQKLKPKPFEADSLIGPGNH